MGKVVLILIDGCLDETGHAHGYESTAYEKTLTDADEAVGYLLDGLNFDAVDPDRTKSSPYTIFFQSDHGGIEFDHTQACPEVMTIPWMVSGPGIRPGQLDPENNISVLDTFPTVLHCMDLPCPDQCSGRLVDVFAPGR